MERDVELADLRQHPRGGPLVDDVEQLVACGGVVAVEDPSLPSPAGERLARDVHVLNVEWVDVDDEEAAVAGSTRTAPPGSAAACPPATGRGSCTPVAGQLGLAQLHTRLQLAVSDGMAKRGLAMMLGVDSWTSGPMKLLTAGLCNSAAETGQRRAPGRAVPDTSTPSAGSPFSAGLPTAASKSRSTRSPALCTSPYPGPAPLPRRGGRRRPPSRAPVRGRAADLGRSADAVTAHRGTTWAPPPCRTWTKKCCATSSG